MEPTPELDPLDALSGVFVEREFDGRKFRVELSFRQLQVECANDMKLWDSIGGKLRADNQVANDRAFRPLKPYEGLKKHGRGRLRRWRG